MISAGKDGGDTKTETWLTLTCLSFSFDPDSRDKALQAMGRHGSITSEMRQPPLLSVRGIMSCKESAH